MTPDPIRPLPRVLLVEDDPVSRAFLAAAAQATPAEVDVADSVAAAATLAAHQRYDLWLFDANLPDGTGAGLLAQLRARDAHTPALAHTADSDPATAATVLAAGFVEVLVKPLPTAAVQAAIRRTLGLAIAEAAIHGHDAGAASPLPIWDDAAATRALNGQGAHVATLRGLFLVELPQAQARIDAAARHGDAETMRTELHKLRASCGFVGAARLGEAAQALSKDPGAIDRLAQFDEAAQRTLDTAPTPT